MNLFKLFNFNMNKLPLERFNPLANWSCVTYIYFIFYIFLLVSFLFTISYFFNITFLNYIIKYLITNISFYLLCLYHIIVILYMYFNLYNKLKYIFSIYYTNCFLIIKYLIKITLIIMFLICLLLFYFKYFTLISFCDSFTEEENIINVNNVNNVILRLNKINHILVILNNTLKGFVTVKIIDFSTLSYDNIVKNIEIINAISDSIDSNINNIISGINSHLDSNGNIKNPDELFKKITMDLNNIITNSNNLYGIIKK